MTVVIDASVAAKWFLEEPGSDQARRLAEQSRLVAPDFLRVECANVLVTAVRMGRQTAEGARRALLSMSDREIRFVPDGPHLQDAQALALSLGRSVYDCLYLAVARAEGASLVTADRRFFDAVSAERSYLASVTLL